MAFTLFGKKKARSIGIDIGSKYIKLIELEQTREGSKIVERFHKEIPEQVIVDREVLDRITLIERLRDIASTTGLEGQEVTAGFSKGVILRQVSVEKAKAPQEELIERAAQNNIPFNLADVVWDYSIIKENPDSWDVLIVAARQEVVFSYIDLLRSSNFVPAKLVPNNIAWEYALKGLKKEKHCIVLDLGYHFTDIHYFKGGALVNSRDIGIGLSDFLEVLRREGGYSYERGVEVLTGKEELEDPSILDKIKEDFFVQIERVFSLFWTTPEEKPKVMYLSGGGATIQGLDVELSERFEMRVNPLDPLRQILKVKMDEGPLFGLAFGLAEAGFDSTGINLLPLEERPVRAEPLYPKIALPLYTTIFALILFGALILRNQSRLNELRNKLRSLEAEERILRTKEAAVADVLEKEKIIRRNSSVISKLLKQREKYMNFLAELNLVLPPNIWFNSITEVLSDTLPTGSFVLKGFSLSNEGVAKFLRALQGSGYFEKVSLNYVKKEVLNGVPISSFEVIVYPGG